MQPYSNSKEVSVQSVTTHPTTNATPLTTITSPEKSEGCFAPSAIKGSAVLGTIGHGSLMQQPISRQTVTDPVTGGQKDVKLQRFDLIPPEFEWALAEAYGVGAMKYADRNWEKGYKWSLSVAALRRHLNAFMAGEWFDPESHGGKTPHIISVAWHAVALFIFRTRGLGTNDIHVNLSKEGQRIG